MLYPQTLHVGPHLNHVLVVGRLPLPSSPLGLFMLSPLLFQLGLQYAKQMYVIINASKAKICEWRVKHNYLEGCHKVVCSDRSFAYGRAPARGLRSNLGEALRRVDRAVAKEVSPVLLPSSHPHDDVWIDGLGGGIIL